MAKTRDDKFKLAFDSFVKDVVGVHEYTLENLTKRKAANTHIYNFKIFKQNVEIGFIDRTGVNQVGDGITETINEEYIPDRNVFERQFNATFDPYRSSVEIPTGHANGGKYAYEKSGVSIINCEISDEEDIYGKIYVLYHKQHIPYNVTNNDSEYEKKYISLLSKFNRNQTMLNNALHDIDDMQDDLLYNERQLRLAKKVLYRETNNNKLSESNLINKLHQVYANTSVKEDCPVCYETIENDMLVIPRCSHYICNVCHPLCGGICPICRVRDEV